MIISLNICVSDIPRHLIKESPSNGKKYLDINLFDFKGGRNEYNKDGYACENLSKEQREAKEKAAMFGSWRYIVPPGPQVPQPEKPKFPKPPVREAAEDDIPW